MNYKIINQETYYRKGVFQNRLSIFYFHNASIPQIV